MSYHPQQSQSVKSYWKAISKSEVGTSHSKENPPTPCQDFGNFVQYGDFLVGAVADGAGSCRYSDRGSKYVVEVTLKFFKEILAKDCASLIHHSEERITEHFHSLLDKIRLELTHLAEDWSRHYEKKGSSNKVYLHDFSCTLLVFVVSPNSIFAMQLGDGFIVVRAKYDANYTLLFVPQKGERVNETVFVTSDPKIISERLQIKHIKSDISFVCSSTDGLERLALNLQENKPFLNFFSPLEKVISQSTDPQNDDGLHDYLHQNFLNSPQINAKTDDDKTILVCSPIQQLQGDKIPEKSISSVKSSTSSLPPTTARPPEKIRSQHQSGRDNSVSQRPIALPPSQPPVYEDELAHSHYPSSTVSNHHVPPQQKKKEYFPSFQTRLLLYCLFLSFFLLYFLSYFSEYFSQDLSVWSLKMLILNILRFIFTLICVISCLDVLNNVTSLKNQKDLKRVLRGLILSFLFAPYILAWFTMQSFPEAHTFQNGGKNSSTVETTSPESKDSTTKEVDTSQNGGKTSPTGEPISPDEKNPSTSETTSPESKDSTTKEADTSQNGGETSPTVEPISPDEKNPSTSETTSSESTDSTTKKEHQ